MVSVAAIKIPTSIIMATMDLLKFPRQSWNTLVSMAILKISDATDGVIKIIPNLPICEILSFWHFSHKIQLLCQPTLLKFCVKIGVLRNDGNFFKMWAKDRNKFSHYINSWSNHGCAWRSGWFLVFAIRRFLTRVYTSQIILPTVMSYVPFVCPIWRILWHSECAGPNDQFL